MVAHEPVLADAARAGRVDVRHVEGADHVGAHQPQEDAGREQAERDGRQDRVQQHVLTRAPDCPTGSHRSDRCRWRRRAGSERVSVRTLARPLTGNQCSQTEKIELEHETGEEHRRRVEEDRADAQAGIRPAVALRGGDHAERDADDEGDDQRVERELERRGAVAEEHFGDGLVVGERGAEVAGEHLTEVLEVLHDDRPVVAGLVDALLQLIGRQPAAERRRDRVAGRPDEEEDERDQDEDGREDQQEPHEQVAAERSAAAAFLALRERGGVVAERGDGTTSVVGHAMPVSCRQCEWGGPRSEPPHHYLLRVTW